MAAMGSELGYRAVAFVVAASATIEALAGLGEGRRATRALAASQVKLAGPEGTELPALLRLQPPNQGPKAVFQRDLRAESK